MIRRRTMSRTVSMIVFVLAGALAGPALADGRDGDDAKRAARSFAQGQAAFEAGDFRRAANAFEAAYAAKPHHAALWNAARSWQRAGEDLSAARDLDRYLREAPPDAPDRDEATAALARVAKRLGRVEIHAIGLGDVRVDGVHQASGAPFFVAPGEHSVSGTNAAGRSARKVFSVGAGETISVVLELPPEVGGEGQGRAGAGQEPKEKADAPRSSSRRFLSPWFVAGGGVLVAVGGALSIASGLETVSNRDAFLAQPTRERLDAGFDSQARTNVLIGVTVGVAALTLVAALAFVDWGTNPRKDVGRVTWRSP